MQFKSVLAICALAFVGAKAVDKTESAEFCYENKGTFVDSRGNPEDDRFACFLPAKNASESNGYCFTFNDVLGCYTHGNMDYCDRTSSEYNQRGCGISFGALVNTAYTDKQNHQNSKDYCYQQNGSIFLEGSMADTRFACLLPYRKGDEKTKYCGKFGTERFCYTPENGNMHYCNPQNKYYNSESCAEDLSYLYYHDYVAQHEKHEYSVIVCDNNDGLFLDNQTEASDKRFACLLPYQEGDENTKYCGKYGSERFCYTPEYGNLPFCDAEKKYFDKENCAQNLGYLYYHGYVAENEKHQYSRIVCDNNDGIFLDNPDQPSDKRFACLLPGNSTDAYCATINGKTGCYAKEYSNMNVCDKSSKEFNAKGCALGLEALSSN